jgi:trigger factor
MTLQTSAESLGKDQVKLRVEVPETDLDDAIGAVYRRWANEIKVPGFRKGKVPRKLIDARVGPEVIREEALRDALPSFYREALQAEELEAIAPPEIEVTHFESGAPIVFEATVDLRPEVALPELSTLNVEAPPSEVTDDEVDEQLEVLRDRFAELEPVSRAAQRGDHVLIDLKGTRNEQPVEGLNSPDLLYEVGSGTGPPSLDQELEGERPGSILRFRDDMALPGVNEPVAVAFTVMLKEVKAKRLPTLDDEFAKTVGEFDTLEELRADVREKLAPYKTEMVRQEVRSRALDILVQASDVEAPEKLVDSEVEHRLSHIDKDLGRSGHTLASYAEQIGTTELGLRGDIRQQAARGVKAELLLEEIARKEEVKVGEEDLGREIAYLAARSERDPRELAQQLASEGRLNALAGDVLRRKALDHLVERVNVIGLPEVAEGEEDIPEGVVESSEG